jgi:preprotein translocase subunit SecA
MRKNVLKYDDVMNRQREVVYRERREVLEGKDISELVKEFIDDTVSAYVSAATAEGFPEDWDLEKLWNALKSLYPISFTIADIEQEFGGREGLDSEALIDRVITDAQAKYAEREATLGGDVLRELERKILLSVLDRKWREHLYEMDYLQEGIGLRAMAQRDPLVEYQKEGFELFSAMMDSIAEEMVGYLFNVEVSIEDENVQAKGLQQPEAPQQLRYTAPSESGSAAAVAPSQSGDVSRNAPCPCGSGKKYKRCHGSAR